MRWLAAIALLGCGADKPVDSAPHEDSAVEDSGHENSAHEDSATGDSGGCDSADTLLWYADADGDGWGDGAVARSDCWPAEGESPVDGDCDTENAAIYPDAYEDCNGLDDDCDGEIDEDDAQGATRWYPDADGDGFGDEDAPWSSCAQPTGYTATGKDCDDADPAIHPGADDHPGDGVDDDCDGEDQTPLSGAPLDGLVALEDADARLSDDEYSDFGVAVSIAGDLDGDGLSDLAVGAPFDDYDDELGSVYVFRGMPERHVRALDADARLTGEDEADLAGVTVAGPGDLDGDGYDDLCVGASAEDTGGTDAGAVYLVSGPVTTAGLAESTARLWGEGSNAYAGYGLSGAGDLNGDGLADLAIGASRHDGEGESLVYVLSGPVSGEDSLRSADAALLGHGVDSAGNALTAAGDVDGDGLGDLLIGGRYSDTAATNAGAAWLALGPISGTTLLDDADLTLLGERESDLAGYAVAAGVDMDGDGLSDLAVGAPKDDTTASDAGAAYLILDAPSGVWSLADAHARLLGEEETALAGIALGLSEDRSGDDDPDLVVSASNADSGRGHVYLLSDLPSGSVSLSEASATLTGDYDGGGSYAGRALSTGSDVSGDGVPDLLIGGPGLEQAWLVLGCCAP